MTQKVVRVPINPANPKTKYRLQVEAEDGKVFKLNTVRVGGNQYGDEESQEIEKLRNSSEIFEDQTYVETVEEFLETISKINSSTLESEIVNIKADLDLTGVDFTPINGKSNKKALIINGNGHKIIGMKVAKPVLTQKGSSYGGGFIAQYAGKCEINDLTFDNAEVYVTDQALDDTKGFSGSGNVMGVVMGYVLADATFNNVSVTNSIVRGYGKVGGIAGMSNPGVVVKFNKCAVGTTTLRGGYNLGGLIGNAQRGESQDFSNLQINQCSVDVKCILDPETEYVELDTVVVDECKSLTKGYRVKGLYATLDGYLYAGKADYGINYATGKHDCTLEGQDMKLANSEICINK